jgi:hypothetical protein
MSVLWHITDLSSHKLLQKISHLSLFSCIIISLCIMFKVSSLLKLVFIRAVLYFIFFVSPILASYNCTSSGAGGSYTASECFIDIPFLYDYADLITAFWMLNFFAGFIPLIIYIIALPIVIEITMSVFNKISNEVNK